MHVMRNALIINSLRVPCFDLLFTHYLLQIVYNKILRPFSDLRNIGGCGCGVPSEPGKLRTIHMPILFRVFLLNLFPFGIHNDTHSHSRFDCAVFGEFKIFVDWKLING